MASRRYRADVDIEEIDRIQRKIMISFNQQVSIARVALDERTQWRDEEG